MSLGDKIEASLRRTTYPIMLKASLGQIPEPMIKKIFEAYFKFMIVLFKIISIATVSVTFLWFLPNYLKLGVDRTILIALVTLIIILRFGKLKVD
jgi:hypothetical protein